MKAGDSIEVLRSLYSPHVHVKAPDNCSPFGLRPKQFTKKDVEDNIMAPGTPHTKMSKKEVAANKKARKQLQEAAKRKEREQMEGENGTQSLPEREPPNPTVEGNAIPISTNGVLTRSVRVNVERPVPNEIGERRETTDNGVPVIRGEQDIGAPTMPGSSVLPAGPVTEAAGVHPNPAEVSIEQLDSDGEAQDLNDGFTQENMPRPREELVGAYIRELPPKRSEDPVQNKKTLAN